MIKRALLVGIDAYSATPLIGCEGDARNLETLLSTNEDASPNFDCKALLSSSTTVTRGVLREHLNELFASEADVALFYFSGHGALVTGRGGVLVTQDARNRDEGVDMAELLALANERRVREVVLIIDCCFGGAIGQLVALDRDAALLREGMAILAASRADQTAAATPNGSVFTNLVRGALIGGAADPVGKVTVASVYAYVEQTLTAWEQRPRGRPADC